MTPEELISQWDNAFFDRKTTQCRLRPIINWEKCGFTPILVSLSADKGNLYIKSDTFSDSTIYLTLSSNFHYSLEINSRHPNIACENKIPENILNKLPEIGMSYNYRLWYSHGIYKLNLVPKTSCENITFIEQSFVNYLDIYLPNELQNIARNPLYMLDDTEIEKLMYGLVPLFQLDGNEVYKYQYEGVQECINIITRISSVSNHNDEKERKWIGRWFNKLLKHIRK